MEFIKYVLIVLSIIGIIVNILPIGGPSDARGVIGWSIVLAILVS